MDKKAVVAELNYIFNVIKSNFDPVAFTRYLTATAKWDTYIKDIAKSHGLKLKPGLNIDKLIESAVQKEFGEDLANDQIEDISTWIKIKIFYPKAEERVKEEEGVDLSKGKRTLKDIFQYMKEKEEKLEGHEGAFVNLIKTMTKNHMNNYRRTQQKDEDQVLIKDVDEGGLENDLDRLPGTVDIVEEVQYKDLADKATKYIKQNGSDIENKVFLLRLKKDLDSVEISEKLKKSTGEISKIFTNIRDLLHKFSMKEDLGELQGRIEKMIERFKSDAKKSSAEETLEGVVARLESLFVTPVKKADVKIASITKYINTLCDKIT